MHKMQRRMTTLLQTILRAGTDLRIEKLGRHFIVCKEIGICSYECCIGSVQGRSMAMIGCQREEIASAEIIKAIQAVFISRSLVSHTTYQSEMRKHNRRVFFITARSKHQLLALTVDQNETLTCNTSGVLQHRLET